MTTLTEASQGITKERATKTLPIWALGFRPFFLAGCAWGALALAAWVLALGGSGLATHVDALWHAHEMIFGFAVAIVVGFLYTASQNWTGVRGIHGRRLMVAAAVWGVGRLAFILPSANAATVAVLDLCFLPVAAALFAPYVIRSGQKHNLVFLVLLSLLWLSNAAYHGERIGLWSGTALGGLHVAVYIIIVMILVIGSRVIPFFTERAIPGYQRRRWPKLDVAILLSALAFILASALEAPSAGATSLPTTAMATVAGTLTLIRWGAWVHRGIWTKPILWILYVGYAWVILGFYLSALAATQQVPPTLAMHAFTAGAISTMIVGMVSRVSLGHTGRPIRASRAMVAAYILITASAALRVLLPLIWPELYMRAMMISGGLWVAALACLLTTLGPILIAPRIDGRPG